MKLWKILFPVTICLVLVLLVLPGSAEAAKSGDYTYTVSYGMATITEVDYDIRGNITVPATLGGYPVAEIGEWAFLECEELTGVTIPDGVECIGEAAFEGCYSLKTVSIPASVTKIDAGAFGYCLSLTGIWVDAGNASYSSDTNGVLFNKSKTTLIQMPAAFSGHYRIPDGVWKIEAAAFECCEQLKTVTIPNSVDTIGFAAFRFCSALTRVYIPNDVYTIEGETFSYCTSLETVGIGSGVQKIGYAAFTDCNKLKTLYYCGTTSDWRSVTILDGNEKLHTVPTYCEPGYIYEVVEGQAIITGYDQTLTGDISIPATRGGCPVVAIGEGAFSYTNRFTSVTIPDTVTTIYDSAFSDCYGLTKVTLPDSLTDIGQWVFNRCSNLLYNRYDYGAYLGNDNNPYLALMATTTTTMNQCEIHPNTKIIGGGAFYECMALDTITIPDQVVTIGDHAFYYCVSLTTAVMGNNVTTVGDGTFYDCWRLAEVYYGKTKEAWEKIKFGVGNEDLLSATIHYGKRPPCVTCNFGPFKMDDTVHHTRICSNCGKTESADHSWNSGVVTKQPTCGATGIKTYTCSICNGTKTETIAKTTNHSWNSGTVTKQPTCGATGIKTYTCSICNGTKTETLAKTSNHTWNSGSVTKQPTCAATGTKTYTCSTCKGTKTETIAATGNHTYGIWQSAGNDDHKRSCTVCGATSTAAHSFRDGNCTVCGEIEFTGTVSYKISAKSGTIRRGDTVVVAVSSNAVKNVKNFGVTVQFDEDVFEYVSGTCNVSGGLMAGIDKTAGKANCYWVASTPANISGTLFTIELKVKDTAALGQVQLTGSKPQAKTADAVLECTVSGQTLNVVDTIPGDMDGNGTKTTNDAVYLLLHVMFGAGDYPVPGGISLDFNGDSKVDTNDAVYLLLHVMFGAEDYPLAA